MEPLDERALSGVDFRDRAAGFRALALEVKHGPLQAGLTAGHRSSGMAREGRRKGRSPVRALDGRGGGARFHLRAPGDGGV